VEFLHFRGKKPPVFAHESERELAELLDANGLPWEYEPHTFPLELDARGRLLEAVTPDFYLPEAGMYIECTEMKPSRAHREAAKAPEASQAVRRGGHVRRPARLRTAAREVPSA